METKTHTILTPAEGMVMRNKADGTYSEGDVYVGRLGSVDDWEERPRAEYEAWLAEQAAQAEEAETVEG